MNVGVNAVEMDYGYSEESMYLRKVIGKIREVQPNTAITVFCDAQNWESYSGWDRILVGSKDVVTDERIGRARSVEQAANHAQSEVIFTPLRTISMTGGFPVVPYTFDLDFLSAGKKSRWRKAPDLRDYTKWCEKAKVVVVPSEHLRKQLLETLGVPLNRAIVAPPGCEPGIDTPQHSLAERPFILASGNLGPSGNGRMFMEVFKKISDEQRYSLVVLGTPAPDEPEDWGPHAVRVQECPLSARTGLYQNCDVFVSMSLTESTSITLLEAIRGGARPVVAQSPGLVEITGHVPVYYDPSSSASLMQALRRVFRENQADRQKAIAFGKQRVAEYTWDKTAWKVLRAFKFEYA